MSMMLPRLLVIAAVSAAAPALAAEPPAIVRTRALIEAFEAVPDPEASDSPAAAERRERAFHTLDGFLDLKSLTEEPIRPRWERFTDAERRAFLEGFRDLVRRMVYPDSGSFFRKATVELGTPRRAEDGAVVVPLDTRLPDEGLRTEVALRWKRSDGVLRVVDVLFDGDSVVQDYRNQFARILSDEGVTGLLRRIEDKRAELARKGR